MVNRRRLLQLGGIAGGGLILPRSAFPTEAGDGWRCGEVSHLLPAVNHRQMLVKCSLRRPMEAGPWLRVSSQDVPGVRSDGTGRFWQFFVDDLEAGHEYSLQLLGKESEPLCDPWPLRTFPLPNSMPEHLRLLVYTCAGGHEDTRAANGAEVYLPVEARRRLLARGLSFGPDAVIANGDHIYWDGRYVGPGSGFPQNLGRFDHDLPLLHTPNEAVLQAVADPQIAALYGCDLRSTPSYFVLDDHDYFENDDADELGVTFPPNTFMRAAQRATQTLYYPEFLDDDNRPALIPGVGQNGHSASFGTLRYGKLLEVVLFDCGGYLTLKGPHPGLVPEVIEDWIVARSVNGDTRQLFHVPSHPMGWSAGKWREWYPDVALSTNGSGGTDGSHTVKLMQHEPGSATLSTEVPKFMWQEGWWRQHQRLLGALTSHEQRPGVSISGDLHASGWSRVVASGALRFDDNPFYSILPGTLGSGTIGFPSSVRGLTGETPSALESAGGMPLQEKNGFAIVDVTADEIHVRQFAWRPPEPMDAIDHLQPVEQISLRRRH